MMTNVGSTKIVNFMTAGAGVPVLGCGHICLIVKMHPSSLLLGTDQTNYVYYDDDQGRVYQNYEFNDLRGRGARVWPSMSYSENALFL